MNTIESRSERSQSAFSHRLVRTPWAQERIRLVAAALLQHGTLSGDDIVGLTAETTK
jgi:hypothetical protein